MKLNANPENIAVMENVEETVGFKMKANSHSFQILSSGIYANKIQAIIREISCNAYDSHVEAGKKDIPFDVHLPTTLEPYFSIRDYGTGLTHQQVFDVYTTYFESTKTDSNDYVGALGLGSKSPFSYTDNFSITAIRDGKKGIYSAFINEHGFPSVVRMSSSDTDEPSGVELKFSVNELTDYNKFVYESQRVFKHFTTIPNFTGERCNVVEKTYKEKNIIDNVHVLNNGYDKYSYVIMGNICYPIDNNAIKTHIETGLISYLDMSLEIHFNIGDVEFQSSREGLSYTKYTVNAIESKLKELESKLDGIIEAEANQIDNAWEKVDFLVKKSKTNIWKNSILNYVKKYDLKYIDEYYFAFEYGSISFTIPELEEKYNISMKQFKVDKSLQMAKNKVPTSVYDNNTNTYVENYTIPFTTETKFVVSDKPKGFLERAKYHFKKYETTTYSTLVTVLHVADKSKPAEYEKFFNDIKKPLDSQIFKAEDLKKKPVERKSSREKGAGILRLQEDCHYTQNNSKKYTWNDNPYVDLTNTTTKYYYIPISGYQAIPTAAHPVIHDIKDFFYDLRETGIMASLKSDYIYGVRKSDLELVKDMPNWYNIQDAVKDKLSTFVKDAAFGAACGNEHELSTIINHIKDDIPTDSEFFKIADKFKHKTNYYASVSLKKLVKDYNPTIEFDKIKQEADLEVKSIKDRYPLLPYLKINYYDKTFTKKTIEYINSIDKTGEK